MHIKQTIKNNRKIIENFSYLSLVQLFNLLLPIITYPYLIRVLGTELYGKVILAQVVATYFMIFISYGFNLSGAKDVAINRENLNNLSFVFFSIMTVKLLFFLVSLCVFLVVLFVLRIKGDIFLLYFFSFLMCLNDLLFPQWFFQGIEKIKYTALVNFSIKTTFLIAVFIFVKDKSDYLWVPILNVLGAIVGGFFAFFTIFTKEKICFKMPTASTLWAYVKNNFPLFLSDIVISIKDRFNVIFIAMFLGESEVAIYDLCIKLLRVAMLPISMLNNAIYPKMSREKNKLFLSKIIKYTFLFYCVVMLLVQPLIPFVVSIIGGEMGNSMITPLRILLLSTIFFAVGYPLAHNGLVVFGKYNLLLIGMILTTIFYLLSVYVCYMLNVISSVSIFAIITVAVYFFEMVYRQLVFTKSNLI